MSGAAERAAHLASLPPHRGPTRTQGGPRQAGPIREEGVRSVREGTGPRAYTPFGVRFQPCTPPPVKSGYWSEFPRLPRLHPASGRPHPEPSAALGFALTLLGGADARFRGPGGSSAEGLQSCQSSTPDSGSAPHRLPPPESASSPRRLLKVQVLPVPACRGGGGTDASGNELQMPVHLYTHTQHTCTCM